ncbi:hypothetical protein HAP32_05176 (plasmid) [Serratia fonticola]|nr:hypothetical protein HAP32_05176 [Serratia fonticola]
MISKRIIFFVALVSTLLLGCDSQQRAEASTASVASVRINALPIIMGVLAGEVPEMDWGSRDKVLNQVCRVAYGEISPKAFRDDLRQAGFIHNDNEKAQKGNEKKVNSFTRLVQSEDVKPYQTACAAYVITSTEKIPDVNLYVAQKKDAKGQPAVEINEEAVINLMPFRLAVARATAELYGKLAASLPSKGTQSMDMYNQKIHSLFAQSAGVYLDAIRKYNQEEMTHQYQLLLLQKGKFTFKSSTGYLVDYSDEGLNLYLYGTPWLANGYIMGVIHGVDIEMR